MCVFDVTTFTGFIGFQSLCSQSVTRQRPWWLMNVEFVHLSYLNKVSLTWAWTPDDLSPRSPCLSGNKWPSIPLSAALTMHIVCCLFTYTQTHSPGDEWAKTQLSPLTHWTEFKYLTPKTDANMFVHKFHWSGEHLSSKRWLSYLQKWSQSLLPSFGARGWLRGGATVWSSHPHATRLWLLYRICFCFLETQQEEWHQVRAERPITIICRLQKQHDKLCFCFL